MMSGKLSLGQEALFGAHFRELMKKEAQMSKCSQ